MAKNDKKNTASTPAFGTEVRDPLHPEQVLRSRRDFLRAGLISSAAGIAVPSVISMVFAARAARGDGISCGGGGVNKDMAPFITVDGAGGLAIFGSIIPLAEDGSLLPSYELQGRGLDPNDYAIVTDMGHPYAVTYQKTEPLGLRTSVLDSSIGDTLYDLSADIKARTALATFCYQSGSDSAANPVNLSAMIAKAGRSGKLLPGVGQRANPNGSGNGSGVLGYDGSHRTLQITDLNQLLKALTFGPGVADLKVSALDKAVQSFGRLSDSQKFTLFGMNLGDQLAALFGCAVASNLQFTNPSGGVDPRGIQAVKDIYKINEGTSSSNAMVIEATLVYNTLVGNCPTATLVQGGCDYHNMTRTTGSGVELQYAAKISRILQLATALNTDVCIHGITDGGISAATQGATSVYTGDNNLTSGAQFYYMSKPGLARVDIRHLQVGSYTSQGVVDTTNYWGNMSTAAQHGPLVAYLGLHGITEYSDYKKLFSIGSDVAHTRTAKHEEALVFGVKPKA